MTVYEIKRRLGEDSYYFDRETMRFFGQTLKDFRVKRISETEYALTAPIPGRRMMDHFTYRILERGEMGESRSIYNAATNQIRNDRREV